MKNDRNIIISLFLVLGLVLLPVEEAPVQGYTSEAEVTRNTLYVPGEIVVGFDRDLPQASMQARATALAGMVGAMVVDQAGSMALLSTDSTADVISLAEQIAGQSGVAYAEPNYIAWIPEADPLGEAIQFSEITHRLEDGGTITRSVEDLYSMRTVLKSKVKPTYPDDEYTNWGNWVIEHDIIWVNKNKSPVVCVIDTGADDQHPDLIGKVIKGYDFINDDKTPNDDNGHGTHVSGTIAAKADNGIGPAGISNGKVLAVKALNAQGWGTDYDIATAIRYCANNKSVKVINMSLGFPEDPAQPGGPAAIYSALDYAINSKNMLAVVAAGNDSVSDYAYPAGWAKDALIGHSLLSVGASRVPWDGEIWVDTNGNDTQTSDEIYDPRDCVTDFSNYGSWVEMIAPGESIYSTLPVSYPFWNNYFFESSPSYDYWNGTSMAAPHVSGAAARVWSFYSSEDNAWIHNRLMNLAYIPVIAEDPSMPDPAIGYNNAEYGLVDEDTIKAPFCWPGSMNDARVLSVAAAMERGGFYAEVTDAITGLPLIDSIVTVVHGESGSTLTTAIMTDVRNRFVDLINIPADGVEHSMYVSKKGYTIGSQFFARGSKSPGGFYWDKWFQVGVPPKNGTTVVANWYVGYNLDLFAFLPAGSPSGVVGSGKSGNLNDRGPGTLVDYPYARWYRDGGDKDWLGVEAITVANYYRAAYPYYLGLYPAGEYRFVLHDYNNGADLNAADPIVRIWSNGKNYFSDEMDDTCAGGETWLGAAAITRSGTSPIYWNWNQCGTIGVWPYAEGPAIFSVNGEQ